MQFNMPAHARAAVISMEARAKNGDDSYRLTDPEVRRNILDLTTSNAVFHYSRTIATDMVLTNLTFLSIFPF